MDRYIVVRIGGRACVVKAQDFRPQSAVKETYTRDEAVAIADRKNGKG